MSTLQRLFLPALVLMLALGCTADLNTRQLVTESVAAMGGAEKLQSIQAVVRKGNGTRTMLAQSQTPGGSEPTAQIKNYVETLDLAKGRAAFEYDLELGEFKQHRREMITKYGPAAGVKPVGLLQANQQTAVVSPAALYSFGTYDTPELGLRRDIAAIMLSAIDTALTAQTVKDRDFNGKICKFGTARAKGGESISLYFDPQTKLLEGYEVTETDTLFGDIPVQYVFGDYRQVEGVTLPHKFKIRKNGKDVLDLQYDSIALQSESSEDYFQVPASLSADADKAIKGPFVPMKVSRVAPGVYHAVGATHNSLAVEFPDYVVIVEAPLNEVHARVMVDELRKQIPLKQIRYAVVTHPHGDHVGGVRTLAALGANILVEKRHEAGLKQMIEARHGYVRDDLQNLKNQRGQKNIGAIEAFEGKKVLTNKGRTLELYTLEDSPHAVPMVIVYLPRERILFETDLYTPGATTPSSAAKNLFESVGKLNLRVDRIVGGHGAATGPFADLAKLAKGS